MCVRCAVIEDEDEDDLRQWRSDCRGELRVHRPHEVFIKFVLLAGILGYRHVAYGLEYPTSIAEPTFSYYSNFAPDWQDKFNTKNMKHHGSRVAYGRRKSTPLPGASDYFWSRRDFFREAEAYGVYLEWVDNIPGRGGTIALVGLGGFNGQDDAILRRKTHILIEETVEAMEKLLLQKNLPQLFVKLTENERKYLLWVLDGKTASEIADIMGISKAAAENMQRKLPERFERKGIFATAFLAYRLGMLRGD